MTNVGRVDREHDKLCGYLAESLTERVCGRPSACELTAAAAASAPGVQRRIRPGVVPTPNAASTTTVRGTSAEDFEELSRLAGRRQYSYFGEAEVGDLSSHSRPYAVVAAVAVADADHQHTAHLRSTVGVRK